MFKYRWLNWLVPEEWNIFKEKLYRDGVGIIDCNPLQIITTYIVNNTTYNFRRIITYFLQLRGKHVHSKWLKFTSMVNHCNNKILWLLYLSSLLLQVSGSHFRLVYSFFCFRFAMLWWPSFLWLLQDDLIHVLNCDQILQIPFSGLTH